MSTPDGQSEYLIVTGTDSAGFYDYQVNLFVTDNLVVSMTVGNGVPDGKSVDVTRAIPPLSQGQMRVIVGNSGWLSLAG
ncbi:MAG TPA: hypothetical protein VGM10_00315 [Actinocrinis sp.]